MARPKRSEQLTDLQERILATAWAQIAADGAAALSLRAIARALHITAPAIYNYFPDRDALVTALITEGYNSLADDLFATLDNDGVNNDGVNNDGVNNEQRLFLLGAAYRQWATTYPQRYLLIFGTPIPHYHAPEEVTQPAAARALLPLINTLQALDDNGRLRTDRLPPLTAKLDSMLAAWQAHVGEFNREVLYLSLIIWSRLHGLVILEISNHIPPFLDDPDELFQRELHSVRQQYLAP